MSSRRSSSPPPAPAKSRGLVRERLLHLVLANPAGDLTAYELSKRAGCTPQWAYEFIDQLASEGWTGGTSKTQVEDLRGLYGYWREVHVRPAARDYHVADPEAFVLGGEDVGGTVRAATTYAAENARQGFLFPSRWDLYVESRHADLWQRAIVGAGGTRGGGNLRLLFHDDHLLEANPWFTDPFPGDGPDGLRVVATPRLILDLLEEGGPGVEAAEMLIDKEEDRLATL